MANQVEKIAAIQHILKSEYNSSRWKAFLSELFTSSNFYSSPTPLMGINDVVASQAFHIGNITLTDNGINRSIAVYEVKLAENIVLERNRVGLRNLLKPHWKEQDAAFIVYYQPDTKHPEAEKWRFSYVSELRIFTENGYVPNNTEPKRYTYVLGKNESCRTAALQFYQLQVKASNATLDDVKEAFSVEKLSKEFFSEYKEHYQDFAQFITGKRLEKVSGKWEEVVKHAPDTQFITIFNKNEKDVRDFCKKLLGRIVFLYFIQKKGWLGVPVTDDWGKGNYNYLSDLFKNCRNSAIFYSEYLSKLFFDTLNQQRPNDVIEIIPGEPCRIPYLNGGLFEEDNANHRNLVLEARLFKNLFDFFDQYNFTIYEDDPNDHTVAVDPEMLGHIFENLLEDNKDKGAYYTPKEIVHYMCQESLIEYLAKWFEDQGFAVQQDSFISFDNTEQTSFMSANEGRTGQSVLEIVQTSQQLAADQSNLSISRSIIERLLKKKLGDHDKQAVIKHADNFNKALDIVKICDPAIGSGAFPMGLLQEIFTAKQTIHNFINGNLVSFDPAKVKLNIIQNSIYGVDIERGAVDIARLRFWLSLVVDEPAPHALPNLDYKIVVGNSLISKLGDDVIEIDWDVKKNTTFDIFGEQETKSIQNILKQIASLQKEFFNPNARKKDQATNIRDLKIELLIEQLNLMVNSKGVGSKPIGNSKATLAQTERFFLTEGWKSQIKKLQQLKTQQDKPLEFFDWQLNFADVLNSDVREDGKAGFDIVIGNPPYVGEKGNKETFRLIASSKFGERYYNRNMDLFYFFFHLALDLVKEKGTVCFITTSYWVTADGAYKLRSDLNQRATILKLLNFGELRLFSAAQGQHNMITQMSKCKLATSVDILFSERTGETNSILINSILSGNDSHTIYSNIEQNKLYDGPNNQIHLKLTNDANRNDSDILARVDSYSLPLINYVESIFRGVETGCDVVRKELIEAALEKKLISQSEVDNWNVGTGIYVLSESELESLSLTAIEKQDCLKPFYKNSDIFRYVTPPKNHRYLLYVDSSTDINLYPNIKKHLQKFRPLLSAREQAVTDEHNWYWIRGSKRSSFFYRNDFIVVPYRAQSSRFSMCEQDIFGSGDVYYISVKQPFSNRALLGFLNSSLILYHLKNRGKRKGKIIEYYKSPLEQIPIHKKLLKDAECVSKFEKIVNDIVSYKKVNFNADTKDLEQKIDIMVYKLYELSFDAVKIIDPDFLLSEAEYDAIKI